MGKLSHEEWLERKQRDLEDQRYEKEIQEKRKIKQNAARERQNAARFDSWLMEKDSYERGVQLLNQLESKRCEAPDLWFEVAVSLNAVDCLRGVYKQDEYKGLPTDRDDSHNLTSEELKSKKTLEKEFFRWSRNVENGHEFENVTVEPELGKTFSLNAQEIMTEYAEQMERPGEYVVPSLKYSSTNIKQAATDKRNLFNPDQAKYNKIHTRLMKSEYLRAREEMYSRLDDKVANLEDVPLEVAEQKILSSMGLGRMARWIEDDLIERETAEQDKKRENREYARRIHESFVKKKESMKVRLPAASTLDAKERILSGSTGSGSKRMDFSRGKPITARSKTKDRNNTGGIDMLLKSGETNGKYLYCSNSKDLELARTRLAKDGYVFKENFKDQDGDMLEDDFNRASEAESKRELLQQRVRDRESKAAQKFEEWKTYKSLRSKALEALDHIDRPGHTGNSTENDEVHWRYVCEQLKAVDTTLFSSFCEWSTGFKTTNQCKVIWDSMSPNICDTCSPASNVHSTLLKFINRPGMNYAEVFDFAVDRKLKKMMYSDGRSLADASEEERQQVEDTLELGPSAFRNMMEDAGIILNQNELRMLETLFDQDGNGKISRKEFLRFTGVDTRPSARGEALQILRGGNMCIWEACDHVSGMGNAYDIQPFDVESENSGSDYESDGGYLELKPLPLRLRSGKAMPGWSRVPLPDLEKRMRRLIKQGDRTLKDIKSLPPASCETSTWSNKERAAGVEALEVLAATNREITETISKKTGGEAPLAPVLTIGPVHAMSDAERQTCLIFNWKPQDKSIFPAFYVLEWCGKEGSKTHKNHDYTEICRDPPSATSDAEQTGEYVMEGLQPGTRYFFRLRAFNGYGASPFTYASFTTAPKPPPAPVVVKSSPTTLTISWGGHEPDVKSKIREVRDIFRAINEKDPDVVNRDTFLGVVEQEKNIFDLLRKMPCDSIPGSTVLEMIEDHPSEVLRWSQLKEWIMSSSGDNAPMNASNRQAKNFQYILCKCVSDELVDFKNEGDTNSSKTTEDIINSVVRGSEWFGVRISSSTNPVAGASSRFQIPKLQYIELPEDSTTATEKPALKIVIDKNPRKQVSKTQGPDSLSDKIFGQLLQPIAHLEIYEPVYVGSDTTYTLSGVDAGDSYQFRVFMVNRPVNTTEGEEIKFVPSKFSASLITHAPAVAPPPPRTLGEVTTDSVTLIWDIPDLAKLKEKSKAKESANQKRDNWMKVVGEWAADPQQEDRGGVSESTLRKFFMRYDRDGNGTIESQELVDLFQDLGITTEGPGFDDALGALDTNGDGHVTYHEFSRWWKQDDMHFVLYHCMRNTNSKGRTPWTVLYRGAQPEAKITGLQPNRQHCFSLQCEMNKTVSAMSNELCITTAPEIPQQPVVVDMGSKHMRVKWYAGHGGADRYVLELMLSERLDAMASPRTKTSRQSDNGDWKQVFDGKSTVAFVQGLIPNSVYRLRVRALNQEKISSPPSLPAQAVTAAPRMDLSCTKSNAANFFSIETTGDLVVGDTVLFTERVFGTEQDNNTNTRRRSSIKSNTLSQQSLRSMTLDEKKKGEFLCERTVAARVLSSAVDAKDRRMLTMEVVWSTLSSRTVSENHLLKEGARIIRDERNIFKFETFRAKWYHEDGRWTHAEEQDAKLESD